MTKKSGRVIILTVISIVIIILGCVFFLLEKQPSLEETIPPEIEGKNVFYENFENGSQNWNLEESWSLEKIDSNTVLKGEGHRWARLKDRSWDNYTFKAKFKIFQGTIHFNYRHSGLEGPHRYFIGVNSNKLYLEKQIGDKFYDLASIKISLKLDDEWHEIEIKGYEDTLNVYINDTLLIVYKDDNPIPSGGIAFETLENSEFLIDDVEIRETLPSDVVTELKSIRIHNASKSGTLTRDEIWSGEINVTDSVEVPKGITLTIEPGTIVKFRHSRDYKNLGRGALLVNGGVLRAIGTPEELIWFTSDAEEPINGDWEGIVIENSKGENIIKYSIVECAFIGIRFWTSSGTVANSIVRWINAEGIYMERSGVVVENNTIYGTGYNGIAMEQFNDVIIRNNKIVNNQGSGIHGEATKAVIENNIVRNSRTGITFDDFSEVTLRSNLIENIHNEALHFFVNSTGHLLFNKIRNSGIGIISFESRLIANNNDIYNNTKNIEINSMQEVDLRENWWGSTNETDIKEKIHSDTEVSFKPFLNEGSVNIQEPVFDYQDVKKNELRYIPGDPEDKYPYIYADEDETRRVVKKICGEKEGFGKYGFGWSLAWDGKYLWRSRHAGAGDLVKTDPETGEIVASFENPGIAQDRGIAFDGKSLWVNDFTQKKVFEIDPETGKILSSFRIPEMGSGSSGIAWDGEYLYLVNWLKQNELYKVDRQGNLIGILKLEKGGGASITFDGQYFWVSPSDKGIRKYNKQGKLRGEIYAAAFGGEAIAHDGKYLWVLHRTQELWKDPKLYKIEVINDQILLK